MDARDRAQTVPGMPYGAKLNPQTKEISWTEEDEKSGALPWFGDTRPEMPVWFGPAADPRRSWDVGPSVRRWRLLCDQAFGWVDASLTYTVKTSIEVCGLCGGTGTHVNPSIDSNGITGEEMAELGDDFRESYFSGVYDVICYECKGRNVVDAVDCENSDPVAIKAWHDWLDFESSYAAGCEAERRAGC